MSAPHASSVASAVLRGLSRSPKRLPPFLFYDAEGSALFERITELDEYYLTRTESAIFERHADDVARDAFDARGPVAVLELGAGSATKTQTLLRAIARRHGRVRFFPADVSDAALAHAAARLAREEPRVDVTPLRATHAEALAKLRAWEGALLVLFIGSSIGNYEDADAVALLRDVRRTLGDRGRLLLGADMRKPLDVLLPAYDDASGVTAAFNKNVLARINRELGGDFDLEAFRHVAVWNEAASSVEMHLESARDQIVRVEALALTVRFAAGERVHTESSHKYDDARIAKLFAAASLASARKLTDDRGWFAVHLAKPA